MKVKICIAVVLLIIVIVITIFTNRSEIEAEELYLSYHHVEETDEVLYSERPNAELLQPDIPLVGYWEMIFEGRGEPLFPLNRFVFELDGTGHEIKYLPDREDPMAYVEVIYPILWEADRIPLTIIHIDSFGYELPELVYTFRVDGDVLTMNLITGAEYSPFHGIIRLQRVLPL